MTTHKKIISLVAIIAILAALYGVWQWQTKIDNQPVRQQQEIR